MGGRKQMSAQAAEAPRRWWLCGGASQRGDLETDPSWFLRSREAGFGAGEPHWLEGGTKENRKVHGNKTCLWMNPIRGNAAFSGPFFWDCQWKRDPKFKGCNRFLKIPFHQFPPRAISLYQTKVVNLFVLCGSFLKSHDILMKMSSRLPFLTLPSRELTYAPKMAFWRWFSFSPGGIN